MKKARIVLYVGAALFAVYALANFFMGFSTYGEYISYYGFGQVFPSIAELFFGTAGWAFLLFGMGAICGHFARQEEILAAIDVDDEDEEFEMIPEADQVEEAAEEVAEEAAEEVAEEAAEEVAAPAPEKEQA